MHLRRMGEGEGGEEKGRQEDRGGRKAFDLTFQTQEEQTPQTRGREVNSGDAVEGLTVLSFCPLFIKAVRAGGWC